MIRALHFCMIAAALTAPFAAIAETRDAQTLIFDAPYLEKVPAPSRIVYSLEVKTSDKDTFGPGVKDEMALNLTQSKSGAGLRDLTFQIYTGDRARTDGPVKDTNSNMAIAWILEWDLIRMKKFIKGEATYFRNRVREAYREKTKVEDVKFTFDGREVSGTKVTIQPFLGDPRAATMDIFHAKTYEVIVSDAVPGGVYNVRIFVPNTAVQGPAQAFIDERITFARLEKGETK
jgi:hypothetical protein